MFNHMRISRQHSDYTQDINMHVQSALSAHDKDTAATQLARLPKANMLVEAARGCICCVDVQLERRRPVASDA